MTHYNIAFDNLSIKRLHIGMIITMKKKLIKEYKYI